MNIFDVFSPDELDELSEDPRVAFGEIVRRATEVLNDRTNGVGTQDEESWNFVYEERHGFLNLVVAAGKRLGIEVFEAYEVPKVDPFGTADWREFKSDLDHYMTQMALDNSIRGKRDAVELSEETKDRIRTYIHELKQLIDKLEAAEPRKAALREKLRTFEDELDKRRLSLLAVTKFAMALAVLPGGLAGTWVVGEALVHKVVHAVAEAKQIEDEQRQLPSTEAPAILSAPRAPEVERSSRPRTANAPAFEGGVDDDIPF